MTEEDQKIAALKKILGWMPIHDLMADSIKKTPVDPYCWIANPEALNRPFQIETPPYLMEWVPTHALPEPLAQISPYIDID